jgi:hypothetical protein
MNLQDLLNQVSPLWEKNHHTPSEEILGLHESADKLHKAFLVNDQQRINKGVANAIIGALSIAKTLNIENLEDVLQKRIEDLKNKLDD